MCFSRTCSPWTSPCSARNVNNFPHAVQVGREKAKQFAWGRAAVQQQGWEKIRRQQGLVAPRFTGVGVRLSTWHHSVVSSPPSLHASCLLFSSQHMNPALNVSIQPSPSRWRLPHGARPSVWSLPKQKDDFLQLTIGLGGLWGNVSFSALSSTASGGLYYITFPHSLVDQIHVVVA